MVEYFRVEKSVAAADRPQWWRRSLVHPRWVDVVPVEDFVAMGEAEAALGIGRSTIGLLVPSGYLRYAVTHESPWDTADLGIVKSTLDAEVPRWRASSRWQRVWFRWLLVLIVNGVRSRLPDPD
jgi:hypothetical protein